VVTARGSQARDHGFDSRWELQNLYSQIKNNKMLANMANAEGHKKKFFEKVYNLDVTTSGLM
jgi:hypothetical protein